MRILLSRLAVLFLVVSTLVFKESVYALTPELLERIKSSVVTIYTRTNASPFYGGSSYGTGFIANKELGLIITNRHIADQPGVTEHNITFYNGQEIEGKVMYYDSWQDFAILKVNPALIPKDTDEIQFSSEPPVIGQDVFIVGNSAKQGFSYHSGHLANLYGTGGFLSQHSYVINLNVVGGASGSPLLNNKGKTIGIVYAATTSYAVAVKGEYIIDAIEAIKNGTDLARKHIGVITKFYSLDHAVKYRNLHLNLVAQYISKYPNAFNKAIVVDRTIPGTPADKVLKNGDIIWSINKQEVGPNLYLFDKIMNNSSNNVELEIYRDGKILKKSIPLYDVNNLKVNKFIKFAGGYFFEANELASSITGAPIKSLMLFRYDSDSSIRDAIFDDSYPEEGVIRANIISFNGQLVSSLDSLIKFIPKLISRKHNTMEYINYTIYSDWNRLAQFKLNTLSCDFSLGLSDHDPKLITYKNENKEWSITSITTEK